MQDAACQQVSTAAGYYVIIRDATASEHVSLTEVNVKGTGSASKYAVEVEAKTTGGNKNVTINTVNIETAEGSDASASGNNKVILSMDAHGTGVSTVAGLNVTAAKDGAALVELKSGSADTTITIQGGTIQGKGAVTLSYEAGANGASIDFSNLDRSLLEGTLTLKVKSLDSQALTVTGTSGNDVISLQDQATADSYTIKFRDWGANGYDEIKDFEFAASPGAGSGGDILNFNAFLGSSGAILYADNTAPAGALQGDDIFQTTNTGAAQLAGNVAFIDGNAALTASDIVSLFGASKPFNGAFTAGGKAVLIDGDDDAASTKPKIWYIHDADSNGSISASEVVLVGLIDTAVDLGGGSVYPAAISFA